VTRDPRVWSVFLDERVDQSQLTRGVSIRGRKGLQATMLDPSSPEQRVRDRFDEGVAYAQENVGRLGNALPGEAFTKAQSSLADLLERQPLVLGAVGLAIGAAVAGAFRISDLENEWVGDLSDGMKADLNGRAGPRAFAKPLIA
jgi:hypothetical protein